MLAISVILTNAYMERERNNNALILTNSKPEKQVRSLRLKMAGYIIAEIIFAHYCPLKKWTFKN